MSDEEGLALVGGDVTSVLVRICGCVVAYKPVLTKKLGSHDIKIAVAFSL